MKSGTDHLGRVLIGATVAAHLRAFHLPWVEYLRENGFQVCGVACDITSCSACRQAFDLVVDIPFSRSALSMKQVSLAGLKLRALSNRLGPNVIHLHTPNAAFWGRLALRSQVVRGQCKVAYTAHGFHFHKNGGRLKNALYRSAERLAARYTNALLTINCEDAAEAERFKLAAGGFHEVLPGAGLMLDRFDPKRFDSLACHSALADSLGLPRDSRFVLMVAELIVRKRHRDALAAFARHNVPNTHLLFAGIGTQEPRTRRLTRDLGLTGQVHFLGYRSDIPKILASSDVVILPSEQEGLPFCILEAMAMEKPVIVADARGSRDLVADECGWKHPIGDSDQLASLLRRVLNDSREASLRAQRGRQRVIANYGWPAVEQKLTSVYRRLGVHLPGVLGDGARRSTYVAQQGAIRERGTIKDCISSCEEEAQA